MTRSLCYVTAIAAAAFCLLVPPASATHVQCGETITTRTVLDSDVNCAAGQPYGLIIGASNVVLQLNGYTIRGVRDGNQSGVFSPEFPAEPRSGVRLKNGTIEGFDYGVLMGDLDKGISDSTLLKLTISTPQGVRMFGNGNTFSGNRFIGNSLSAIVASGDNMYLWRNTYTSTADAGGHNVFAVSGNRIRVMQNSVVCQTEPCSDSGYAGIQAGGENVRVSENTVHGDYSWGIAVDGPEARVTLNESIGNDKGIEVSGQGARVGSNVANNFGPLADQFATGISISGPGVTVANNTANDNSGIGIYAVEGTIDGGGNTASGNGQGPDAPQCTENVQCSSP